MFRFWSCFIVAFVGIFGYQMASAQSFESIRFSSEVTWADEKSQLKLSAFPGLWVEVESYQPYLTKADSRVLFLDNNGIVIERDRTGFDQVDEYEVLHQGTQLVRSYYNESCNIDASFKLVRSGTYSFEVLFQSNSETPSYINIIDGSSQHYQLRQFDSIVNPDSLPLDVRSQGILTVFKDAQRSEFCGLFGWNFDHSFEQALYIPSATALPEESFQQSVLVNVQGNDKIAAQFKLRYDPNVLKFEDIWIDEKYEPYFAMAVNDTQPGEIRIAIASTSGVLRNGFSRLLVTQFKAIGTAGDYSDLHIEEVLFNEEFVGSNAPSVRLTSFFYWGKVLYKGTNEPVENVRVTLDNERQQQSTTTHSDGRYSLGGGYFLPVGLFFQKDTDEFASEVITAYDAALAARCAAGLSQCDPQVADVNRDSRVTAYDPALIARHAVGHRDQNYVGVWEFNPNVLFLEEPDGEAIEANNEGIVIGNVSGNYLQETGIAADVPTDVTYSDVGISISVPHALSFEVEIDSQFKINTAEAEGFEKVENDNKLVFFTTEHKPLQLAIAGEGPEHIALSLRIDEHPMQSITVNKLVEQVNTLLLPMLQNNP